MRVIAQLLTYAPSRASTSMKISLIEKSFAMSRKFINILFVSKKICRITV